MSGSDEHILINVCCSHIQGSTKYSWQHEGVSDGIGSISKRCCYHSCPSIDGCFWRNTWVWYCEREQNGTFCHRADHLWCDRAPCGESDENIGVAYSVTE